MVVPPLKQLHGLPRDRAAAALARERLRPESAPAGRSMPEGAREQMFKRLYEVSIAARRGQAERAAAREREEVRAIRHVRHYSRRKVAELKPEEVRGPDGGGDDDGDDDDAAAAPAEGTAERVVAGELRGGEMHYLVQWRGDEGRADSWVAASGLEAAAATELAAGFEEAVTAEMNEMEAEAEAGGEAEAEVETDETEGVVSTSSSGDDDDDGSGAAEMQSSKRQRHE